MSQALTVLWKVLTMMIFMLPGFVGRKVNIVKEDHIKAFTNLLLYLCTPFMIVSTFLKMDRDFSQLLLIGLFFVIFLAIQALAFLILGIITRRKKEDVEARILCIQSICGNVGYIGLPLLSMLYPEEPIIVCYACMAMVSMNILLFTVGAYFVSGDRKYVSLRSAFINPATLGFIVALPLYLLGMNRIFPDFVLTATESIGNICGPLSMIILGIRLASSSFKAVFCNWKAYLAAAVKLLIFPLFTFALIYFIPLPTSMRSALIILSAVPSASAGLGVAELHGKGMQLAANALLISTLLCFITLPLITLLLL